MNITAILMGVIVLIIGIMDLWLYFKRGPSTTFSAKIIRYYRLNAVAFLTTIGVGITLGHLFWSMSDFKWKDPKVLIKECETYIQEHKK